MFLFEKSEEMYRNALEWWNEKWCFCKSTKQPSLLESFILNKVESHWSKKVFISGMFFSPS